MTQAESDYRRVEKALRYVAERAREQPALEEIARQVHLSPFHFNRLFRRWAGTTPKRFLQYVTKEHAKRLLRDGADVLGASQSSGLSGPGRLHDLLVNWEAVTPGEYKARGKGLEIRYAWAGSPFGLCFLAATARGLCALRFAGGETRHDLLEGFQNEWPGASLRADAGLAALWEPALRRGFRAGDRRPLHVQGTPFQLKVWQALVRIPEGRLVSYQALARAVGSPGAARAVGSAVGANSIAVLIPCHRVIREAGEPGGYRWSLARKQALIAWEAARKKAGS